MQDDFEDLHRRSTDEADECERPSVILLPRVRRGVLKLAVLAAAVGMALTACSSDAPATPTSAQTPLPTATATPTSQLLARTEPIALPTPTLTPTSEPPPTPQVGFGPGIHEVGKDISPGTYRGKAESGGRDSCYWERLSGVSGESSDIIANDNAIGQFFVEILDTDKYFKTACAITPLDAWPKPVEPLSRIEPGTYLIGRDISPGTYHGKAESGGRDSCYWERLSGVSGESSDIIANDNAIGQFFVSVKHSDIALSTKCALELAEGAPTPTLPPTSEPPPTPQVGFGPGIHEVGKDISPGTYRGKAESGGRDSCYWERLSGVSGESSDIIANDNAIGQFFVEILDTDKYFKTACAITPLDAWPKPVEPLSRIEPGTYLIGRDISPGTYHGKAESGGRDSCYWERLSGVSGESSDIIANDNAIGQFFVSVKHSDIALSTKCALELAEGAPTPTLPPTSEPPPTPQVGFGPGIHEVGKDISPGTYRGKAESGGRDSCYWERLSGVSGESSDIIANDNAIGQFFVEILDTDKYFKTACAITPLDAWPKPVEPLSRIEPGTYLIGRDISPGTYRGKAESGGRDSCYWERLSGVSGEFSDVIANDNAIGQFFVSVKHSDIALSTKCALELAEGAPTPTLPPTPTSTHTPTATPTATLTSTHSSTLEPSSIPTPAPTSTPTPIPSGRWQMGTYEDATTGSRLPIASLSPVDASDDETKLTVYCTRANELATSVDWGGSVFVIGAFSQPRKAPVQYFLDGTKHLGWWSILDHRQSLIPQEDIHTILTQLSDSTVAGFEIYDYGHGDSSWDSGTSPEAWARFEVPGLSWVLSQMPCSVPQKMVTLSAAKSALTRVEVHDAAGSGVVIRSDGGDSHMVTAWHVVESYCTGSGECVGVSVVHNGKRHHAQLLRYNAQEDIALLGIEAELPVIPLGGVPPLESPVTTIGLPEGEHDFQYNEGIVVGYDGCSFDSCLRTNAKAWSGFSGGALINPSGELVGVISEGWRGSFYSNAVSTEAIKRLLSNAS